VVVIIILVVGLGGEKRGGRGEIGHDRLAEGAAGGEVLIRLQRGFSLRFGVEEDDGAILRAEVVALAVEGRGVVNFPEDREQLLVGDEGRVILDLHGLRVPGLAGGDQLVDGFGTSRRRIPK